jgi:nucleoside-diphosphate-sugar epimerase
MSDDRLRAVGLTWPPWAAGAERGPRGDVPGQGRTAFITGASGFIGRHLTGHLATSGWRVRCLVREASIVRPLRQAGAELVRGDVTQPDRLVEAIAGADVVFHVAGVTAALRRADYMRINGDGTWNVARACAAQSQPPTLVVVSSLAAAGPTGAGRIRTEADPPAPVSDYGRSKRAGELAAEAWAHCVPTTILRPGIVFGEWNRELLPMFRAIDTVGVHVVPTFSPPPLSYIHVADFVRLTMTAAEHGTRVGIGGPGDPGLHGRTSGARPKTAWPSELLGPGGASRSSAREDSWPARPPNRAGRSAALPGYYFAAVPEYPTYLEFGRMSARLLGRRHVVLLPLAEPLVWLTAGVTEVVSHLRGQPLHLSLDKMREATAESWACSPDAARTDLGFSPPFGLEQRLGQTIRWYRARRWL